VEIPEAGMFGSKNMELWHREIYVGDIGIYFFAFFVTAVFHGRKRY